MARVRLVCWALILGTLVLFAPVRSFDFVNYDDPEYLTANRHINGGLTAQGLTWAFGRIHGDSTYWHPLTWVSHMVDCELFGLNPAGHHIVNVLMQALNGVLLFLVLRKMTGALWPSAMVAALFLWHPLQVDTVAWVAERKNLISGLFWIITMGAYLHYVRRPVPGRYALVLLLYVTGLMCKPVLVVLPCALLLLDFWPLRRWPNPSNQRTRDAARDEVPIPTVSLSRLILEKAPLFLLAGISSFITVVAHQRLGSLVESTPISHRLSNAVVSYVRYLAKAVWPSDLSVLYPLPAAWPITAVLGSLAVLLIITAFVVSKAKRRPYLVTGWLWFLGVLVPYIGIIQAGLQSMADRFAYLPLIGLFVALVWGVQDLSVRWARRTLTLSLLAGLTLGGSAIVTSLQLRHWRNSVTLFSHAVAVTTNNAPAHINLGIALEAEGRRDEALQHYQQALRISPLLPQVHNNIGNVLDSMGRTDEAIQSYLRALELRPGVALVHCNLATALVRQGKVDEAMAHYTEAMRLAPADPEPHFLAAQAYYARGDTAKAIEHFRTALRLDPEHVKALRHLARLLAANENAAIRNGAESLRLAERAVERTGGQPLALDVLGMAYAELGRFEEAAATAQEAIDRLNAAGEQAQAREVQSRLELYRSSRPFREPVTNAVPTL